MSPPIILISAMSFDRVIGTEDGMPWNVPEEYEQYLNFITGETVIMGRRSYEIFGNDLTSKNTFVISRNMRDGTGYRVFKNLDVALDRAKSMKEKIFVAGGASIYSQALPLANEMYLSIIKGNFKGIAYFPEYEKLEWEVVEHTIHTDFEFFRYTRKT